MNTLHVYVCAAGHEVRNDGPVAACPVAWCGKALRLVSPKPEKKS